MENLEERVKKLPPDLQREIEDFVRFLVTRRGRKHPARLKLGWRGALRDMRRKFTSVELQHKASEWWGD
jgi:hypothetical protein